MEPDAAEGGARPASRGATPAGAAPGPDYGSDGANIKVPARPAEGPDGEAGYVINGVKTWCTFGARADVLALLFSDVRRQQGPGDAELRALRNPNERQRDILTTRATQLLANPVASEVGRVVEQTFVLDQYCEFEDATVGVRQPNQFRQARDIGAQARRRLGPAALAPSGAVQTPQCRAP